MNKKTWFIILLAITLIPFVSAQIAEGIEDTLSAMFNATGDIAYAKAGIWLLAFIFIFKSLERIIPYNRGAAAIASLVISMLGIRFMPEEYFEYIAGFYTVLFLIIFFLIPYLLGSFIADLRRWGSGGKIFLILLLYGAIAYALFKWQGVLVEEYASSALSPALVWIDENTVLVFAIIALICIYLLLRGRGGGGGGGGRMPRTPGPGFWSGLGSGAGGTYYGMKSLGGRSAMGLAGWLQRRRAAMALKKLREQQRPKGDWPGYG